MIRYVVLLKFKASAPKERIQRLMSGIPEIMNEVGIKWFIGLNAGLPRSNADYIFMAEFPSMEALEHWASPSPPHAKITELLTGLIESQSVIHVIE